MSPPDTLMVKNIAVEGYPGIVFVVWDELVVWVD